MQVGEHKVVVTRKAIKHLYLRVTSTDCVDVSAPMHWPVQAIRSIVAERSEWITQQQQKLAAKPPPVELSFRDGEALLFEGKRYRLAVTTTLKKNRVSLSEDTITLALRQSQDKAACEALLERWYREQLKQRIEQLLTHWQPIMKVTASDFGVRKMKTRWGSCNTRTSKIWLNLELIKKSPQSLEYVVVHELTHLYERYHNQRFYALMDQFLPDWRERRHRLNRYE